MNLEIKDCITLKDNKGNNTKYVVTSKINYEEKNYYYLVDINNKDLKFCYEDKDDLVELNDKELVTKLLPLFYEKAKSEITDFIN